MPVRNFEDRWLVGSRFYFRRDPVNGTTQPTVDLGVIDVVNPNTSVETAKLYDSYGGTRRLVETGVTSIDETYELACANISLINLSLLFLGTDPAGYTQTAQEVTVTHWATPEYLLGLLDSNGNRAHALSTVAGFIFHNAHTAVIGDVTSVAINSINKIGLGTSTIVTASDISAQLAAGEALILRAAGLTDILNSRTYTVKSVATTTITIEELPSSSQTSGLGSSSLLYATNAQSSGGSTILGQGTIAGLKDWDVYGLDEGYVRFLQGGTGLTTAANVLAIYSTAALSGKRLVSPQDAGLVTGYGEIWWGRDGATRKTVRRFNCQIAPAGGDFKDQGEWSRLKLTVSVLNDLTKTSGKAGDLILTKGSLPTND